MTQLQFTVSDIPTVAAFALIFHAYLGYPLSLLVLSRFQERNVARAPFFPPVSLIITAHNEVKRIRTKLENTLLLEYPTEKLEVIVASDGSTDETNAIVAEFARNNVRLLALPFRRGKEAAQKAAVESASGKVLAFTDTATMLEPGGLARIVSNFADSTVGCVSSEDRILDASGVPTGGEGLYVRYEMWLRRLESGVGSLVGMSGSFFAARSEVCSDFSTELPSDFRTVLNSVKLGLRSVTDPEAIGSYSDLANPKKEFQRKVRTVLRGMTAFSYNLGFLNPYKYGLFSYQYLCHKLLRWLVPLCMILILVLSVLSASDSMGYRLLLYCQIVFYSFAGLALRLKSLRSIGLFRFAAYFFTVNLSIAHAWCLFLMGRRITLWSPSDR